jgi:hypothetical protein
MDGEEACKFYTEERRRELDLNIMAPFGLQVIEVPSGEIWMLFPSGND